MLQKKVCTIWVIVALILWTFSSILLIYIFFSAYDFKVGAGFDPKKLAHQTFEDCNRVKSRGAGAGFFITKVASAHGGGEIEGGTNFKILASSCAVDAFADLMEKRGMKQMALVFTEFQKLDPQYQSCHLFGHEVMAKVVHDQPDRWEDFLSEVDPGLCGGGFFHGIFEGKAAANPEILAGDGIDTLFTKLCGETFKGYVTGCGHIFGHIFLVEEIAVEPDGYLDRALERTSKACSGLGNEVLFSCYGGLFMEDSFRFNLVDHELVQLPVRDRGWRDKSLARCEKYSQRIQELVEGCWYDLAEVFAQVNEYEPLKTYRECDLAPSHEALWRCYVRASYIIGIVPPAVFNDAYIAQLCPTLRGGEGSERYNTKCIRMVVGAMLSNSLSFLERAVKFCDHRAEPHKSACFGFVGNGLTGYVSSQEERAELCRAVPESYRHYCTRGI